MNLTSGQQPNLFWKLLSYIVDIPIEQLSSEFNPTIHLFLSCGEFKLVSDTAIYSYGLKYEHFVAAFKKIKIESKNPKSILILGLGTGSIPQMLQSKFNIQANFDFVEKDPEIIFLFEKYQDYIFTGQFKCYCEDGLDFLKNSRKKYDLICMDIFEDSTIPKKFESKDFLELLKANLNVSGILLYNRLHDNSENQKKNNDFLVPFSQIFPRHLVFKHDYNWILIVENDLA
ncbi:MAG: fused MFS/spermidine synthase [Saprospiraceae bacterium]|nr:fused MFS/spermidine synthase [Saprospiraceae bacterium]